ncbi:MAG: histidine phosphatase family protein [Chloroflexi bacterium]|nr:histidine phosphatase family protein [Chloroflexota bacterium]
MTDNSYSFNEPPEVPLSDRGYSYKVGTELYFVRHGESMTNTYKNLVAYDPNLTAHGWKQALSAGQWMAEHAPVDVVITSPLRRAHSTALAIAHAQGLQPIEMAGLEEFSQGFWNEIPQHHPTRPWWGRLEWEPSFEQHPRFIAFRDRVYQALSEILEQYAGQRVCVVSHGGTMGVLTAAMVGARQLSVWTYNTGISHFVWPEWKRWMVHYINRVEHLIPLRDEEVTRVSEAHQDEDGFWVLPDRLIDSWSALPAQPDLAFLSNRLRRSDSILFIRPPDPITPLRVSLRSRRAVILSDDLAFLEEGEVRRAALNANHLRYQYLFDPIPYPDHSFDYIIIPDTCELPASEIDRLLKTPSGLIRWPGAIVNG